VKTSGNRVLLVYPSTGAQDLTLLPLSLLVIAQPLLEHGIDVEIIDQRFERAFFETLAQRVAREPICIGINCITGPQIEEVVRISRFLKTLTDAPIVLGGPHPTLFPAQTLESPLIDYVVIDRGEAPFLSLVKALRENRPPEGVPRIGYKDNGNTVFTKVSVQDITVRDIPYPLVLGYGRPSTVPILTSYGCPYDCAFCVEKVLHPVYQELPSADVVYMIEEALRLAPQFITVLDDNFLLHLPRVMEVFGMCRQKQLNFRWACTARADVVSRLKDCTAPAISRQSGLELSECLPTQDETLAFLKRTGLVGIYFGIESGSQKILTLINKEITPDIVLDLNLRLRAKAIVPHYSFMTGFPGETRGDFEKTVQLMDRLKQENPEALIWKINRYTPYPGTKLFDVAVQTGFRPPPTFEGWSRVHFYSEEFGLAHDVHL
jgi:anaerobic magnesium-protoporphyrin IX monomethyl ester cyclase